MNCKKCNYENDMDCESKCWKCGEKLSEFEGKCDPETNLLPCPFCGSKPERFVKNDILHIKCPECVSVGLYNHVRFGCLSDALWNQRNGINHCEPEAASRDQIELGKLAAFGESVWDWIKANPDFCGDEFALTLMPMAEKAGLCKYETYDPEKHGEFSDLVPGEDELYYWGSEL